MAEPQQTIEGSVTITGSIEVLGDVKNPALDAAMTKIETIAGEVQYVRTAVDEQTLAYSIDGLVTPGEKADIKNNWASIEAEYPAIMQRAGEKGISAGTIGEYATACAALRAYLFGEPGILLDLTSASTVEPHSYGQVLIQYITKREEVIRQIDRKNITSNFETRYKRSASIPETPTGSNPSGWTLSIPMGEDSIWMSGAMKSADGSISGEWYPPVRFTNVATLTGVLSNDRHTVPTDLNGENGNYTGAESKLFIYEGSQDKTSEFTMGYSPSAGVTVDAAHFASTKIARVTAMSVDAGYVDLQGARLGTTITKRFNITKARQGDPAPVHSMGISTVVCLVKPDGTKTPGSIQFNATKQVGTSAPQAYPGIFKFFVDDTLWFESTTPQSEFSWSGFELLYPGPDVFPDDYLFPVPIFNGNTALASMRVELWDTSGSTKLDGQTVVFIADWGNYLPGLLQNVPDYVPKYLGRFEQAMPVEYHKGDSWLVYGLSEYPYQRGVYYYNGTDAPFRITDSSGINSKIIAEALPDILWATKNGYGTTNLYGAVTYIENLVSNNIFVERLQADLIETNILKVGAGNLNSTIIQDGLIKSYLINVDAIKAIEGFFDLIVSKMGRFEDCEIVRGLFTGHLNTPTIFSSPGTTTIHGPNTWNQQPSQGRDIYRWMRYTLGLQVGTYAVGSHSLYADCKYITIVSNISEQNINMQIIWRRSWAVAYKRGDYSTIATFATIEKRINTGGTPPEESTGTPDSGESSTIATHSMSVRIGGDELYFKELPRTSAGLASGRVWLDGTTLKVIP